MKNIRDSVVLSKTARFSAGCESTRRSSRHRLPLSPMTHFFNPIPQRKPARRATDSNFLSAVTDPGASGQQVVGFEGEPHQLIGQITAGTSAGANTRMERQNLHTRTCECVCVCVGTRLAGAARPGADG